MEIGSFYLNLFKFRIGHLNAGWIDVGVQLGFNFQARSRGRRSDQIDDDFVADQMFPAPVQADMTEHPMLNLIPRARPRQKMTHRNAQSRLVGKPL